MKSQAIIISTILSLTGSVMLAQQRSGEQTLEITPLTSDGVAKWVPQLSPDGKHMVYRQWTDSWDLFVTPVGGGTVPRRLTDSPENSGPAVWSPDGTEFAFFEGTGEQATLYTMPAPLGGQRRRIADVLIPFVVGEGSGGAPANTLSWSPNGQWLAVTEGSAKSQLSLSAAKFGRIVLISPRSGEKQPLTDPPRETMGDRCPSFSPDGSQLAFVRSATSGFGSWDLWVQPVHGAEARQLTFESYEVFRTATWTSDSREIIFAASSGITNPSGTRVFRISVTGGKPQPIAGLGGGANDPCIRGDRLVFVQYQRPMGDIWRIPGPASDAEVKPQAVIQTKPVFTDDMIDVSRDGRKIAFMSTRTGSSEIWMANSDGSKPVRLTTFEHVSNYPNWSPDGQKILFSSDATGDFEIYVVDAGGGEPRQLTRDPGSEEEPIWSHDGRWIYFRSHRSGRAQIWKMAAEGGEAIQITRNGGVFPRESADGKYVYYFREGKIWRMPTEGGEETEILEGIGRRTWNLLKDRLYYARADDQGFSLNILDLTSSRSSEIFRHKGSLSVNSVVPSPDDKWIYYALLGRPTTDLLLVENFR